MSIIVKSIEDVVNYQLCTGCGACASVVPDRYKMVDVEHIGRRPNRIYQSENSKGGSPNKEDAKSVEALGICPGNRLEHSKYLSTDKNLDKNLLDGWGPILGVWEGYSADEEIRFKGSSGGAATILALFALEKQGYAGVLHSGKDVAQPLLNKTMYSRNRSELIANSGSRYAPASPCEGLVDIAEKTLFIGKPCDAAAVHNLKQKQSPLVDNVGITIGFFCAGVPSTEGNKSLIKRQGLDADDVKDLKYRGEGWPGLWKANTGAGAAAQSSELTYADSWGYLQRFRQWRCYICPDHTGEFADISVGDPWYREVQEGEAGKSLIVARTQKGLEFLLEAEKQGYIKLERRDHSLLPRSQSNLIQARGSLWGRLLVLKLCGAPIPKFINIKTFKFWLSDLSLLKKLQSFWGTLKRVRRKHLNKSLGLFER